MFNWFKKKKTEKEIEENNVEEQTYEDPQEYFEEADESTDEVVFEEIEEAGEIDDSQFEEEAVEEVEEIIEGTQTEKKTNFFEKLKGGLTKTRKDMSNKIENILSSHKKVDDELFEDLEEVLVTADVGAATTMELIDRLKAKVKSEKINDPMEVKELLKDEIKSLMKESVDDNVLSIEPTPAVILVVGVNGVGKTTTIGKLSYSFKN